MFAECDGLAEFFFALDEMCLLFVSFFNYVSVEFSQSLVQNDTDLKQNEGASYISCNLSENNVGNQVSSGKRNEPLECKVLCEKLASMEIETEKIAEDFKGICLQRSN